MLINDFTLNFPYVSPIGYCGFRLKQEIDPFVNMFKIVAVHNCKNYGVDLSISFRQNEWQNSIARQLSVKNAAGVII